MAFKKINKEFVLSDSSVNVYGFRLLTSGYVMDEFVKNPIGYYMHVPDDGVLMRWEDVRLDGDRIIAMPSINMLHPRGERTATEIEEGFLNAASMGKICVLEYVLEDNPDDAENPVLVATRWYNKECSIVDNPGNRNAMKVSLVDADGKEINLADVRQAHVNDEIFKTAKNMTRITLPVTPELISLLGLDDGATADMVVDGIRRLHSDNETLTGAKAKAEKDLADLQDATVAKEVKALLAAGVKDGKINQKLGQKLEKQYAGKPAELKDLLDDMQVYVPLDHRINILPDAVKDLADKSYDVLNKSNKLELLKQHAPDLFAQKYKEKFGKEYKGK